MPSPETTQQSTDKKGKWGSQIEFILTSVGCAVGLGNVWRFPYLTYTSGGGAFLVPFFLSLFLIGIPMFSLDISLGQFTSLGPIAAMGNISPVFRGLGMCMVCIMGMIMVYYSVIIATCFHYLFFSLRSYLPWSDCLNEWNTCACRQNINDTEYLSNPYIHCENFTGNTTSAGEEYYTRYVLGESSGIDEAGTIQWQMLLCSLFTWTIMYFVLIKGVKSIGKLVYVFTLLPYVLLTVLLVRGLTLDGYADGIYYYLNPKIELLQDPAVWAAAAVQIFFSTSTSSGALIAMSSFNQFKTNVFRDSLLVPIINALTSFYGGFATFAILGFMAAQQGVEVDAVTKQGPGLAFVVYPEALAKMPAAPFWSVMFFLMMISLGISSMLTGIETIVMSLMDAFPILRESYRSYVLRGIICFIGFLLNFWELTQAGSYIINLLDTYVGGFPLLFAGLFEIIVLMYVYGFRKYSADVLMMTGNTRFARYIYKGYFLWCWTIITPVAIVVVIISKSIEYEPITNSPGYPDWAEALGWLAALFPIIMIPGYAVYYLIRYWLIEKQPFSKMWKSNPAWGPLLAINRTGRYASLDLEMKMDSKGFGNTGSSEKVSRDLHSEEGSRGIDNPDQRVYGQNAEGVVNQGYTDTQ